MIMPRAVAVVVGSVSGIKVGAVATAVSRVFGVGATVTASRVDSGVDDQPWDQETLRGALNRARAAYDQGLGDIGIGIESGLAKTDDGFVESVTWVVAIGPDRDGAVTQGRSRAASYLLPADLAALVCRGMSLGVATRTLRGSRPEEGTVGPLTGGRFDRRGHYVDAVMLALIPFYP